MVSGVPGTFSEEVLLRLAVLPFWDGCDLLEELGEVPGEGRLDFVLGAYEAELGIGGDVRVADVYGVDLTGALAMMMSGGWSSPAYHEVHAAALARPGVGADRLVRYLRVVTEAFIGAVEERAEEAGLNPRRFGWGFGVGAWVGDLSGSEVVDLIFENVQGPVHQQIVEVAAAAGEHEDFAGLSRRESVGILRAKVLRRVSESRFAGAGGPDELRLQADGALLLAGAAIETAASSGFAGDDVPFTTPLGVPRSADAAAALAAASYPYLNRLGLPEGHLAYTEAVSASLAVGVDADRGSELSGLMDSAAVGATMNSPASDQAFERHRGLAAARSASGSGGARLAPGAIHSIIDGARYYTDFSQCDVVRVPQYLLAGGVFDSAFAANTWAQRLAADVIGFHALTAAPFYVPAALMPAVADAEPLDPGDLADLRLPYRANLVYFEQPIDVTAISRTPAAQPVLFDDSNGVALVLPPDRINGLILFSEADGTIAPLVMWIGSFDGQPLDHLHEKTIESFLAAARWAWLDNDNGPDPYRPFVGELIECQARVDLANNADVAKRSGFVFQPAWLPDCDYPDSASRPPTARGG